MLANTSVNLAGQSSKVGGQVTRVFGWIVLVLGSLLAAGAFAACSAIAGAGAAAPFILAVPLALVSWVLAYFLLKGGKSLEKSGEDRQKATRAQAVFALANTRGGMVTPADLAHAIGVSPKDADDMLTVMAKESPDHVSIEVDDNGTIYYRFAAAHWSAIASNPANWERPRGGMAPNAAPPVRGAARNAPAPRARVAETAQPQPRDENVRVDARDPVEDELATEPPETSTPARRHAR